MDEGDVFVDRPLPIALFERLYLRDEAERRPLPIVVVLGAGGAGRTRLLDYLYSRGKDPLTCALVRVRPSGGPRSLLELLDAIQEELASDPHPQCGLIQFPRYELGKWMREIVPVLGPRPDHEQLRIQLKGLLNRRFRAPGDAGQAAQSIYVVILQWLVELLLPAFLVKPSIIRRVLWGRHRCTGFVWYERHQQNIELPTNRHMGDVIRRVCLLLDSGDADDVAAIERLLVSAFLDDLRAAYDPDETRLARVRTTQCVAFVDDIDLLPEAHGFRLLELLAERRATDRGQDPLLLVVTSQRWWSNAADSVPQALKVAAPEGSGDPAAGPAAVEATHNAWLDALRRSRVQGTYPRHALFLPLALPRLTRAETRRLITRTRPSGQPEAEDALAEEVFQATHGHPQAIHVVRQILASRRPGAPRLGIRRIMREPFPGGLPDLMLEGSIDESLLSGFLEPAAGRLDQRLIAACALPRILDVSTLHILLDLPPDEVSRLRVMEIWDELASYAFTEATDDGRLVFHPLLRDMLIRDFVSDDDSGQPLSYTWTHTRLAGHFAAVADEHPAAIVDCIYHELASGRVASALGRLRHRVRTEDPAWREELLAVAQAPSPHDPPWYRGFRVRTRGSDPLATLVDRAREVYSPTSDTAWNVDLLEDLGEALDEVDGEGSGESDGSVRLTRPFEAASDEKPPDGERPRIRTDEDEPFWCPSRPSHRGLRRVVTVAVLLVPVLAYLGAYRAYAVETCDPASPLRVWAVVADRVNDDGIRVHHAGPGGRGPCVGITIGDDFLYSRVTENVQRLIDEQNEGVVDSGRPYVTAVVMTTLTGPDAQPSKETAAGRSELEGVYLAQRDYNQAGYVPRLRVLVANSGPDAEHANEVAQQIVRAAEHDPTIVAVLGLGEGTDDTLRAVEVLGEARLPVIASTASGDAFRAASESFFRVAVPNERQAAVAAAYATHVLDATTAIVIEDRTDAYSRNLATDFTRSFTDDEHRMSYLGPLTYDASRDDATNTLTTQVARACRQHPDLIFYAGRADDAETVLDALADPPCDPSIALMGGHSLSLLGVPPFPPSPPEIDNPVYYTAMAAPAAWRTGQVPEFFPDYRGQFGQGRTEEGAAPNTRAALAYDAANVLANAVARAPDAAEVDRYVVGDEVRQMTGPLVLAGASGVVDFDPDLDGDPRLKAVMLMQVTEYGRARWIGACGRIAVNPDVTTAAPEQIPCPGT